MFRCQDKGARLAIEFKERYNAKVISFLEDTSTFREEDGDKSGEYSQKVKDWAGKMAVEG